MLTLRSCKLWIKIENLNRTLKSFYVQRSTSCNPVKRVHKKYSLGRKSCEWHFKQNKNVQIMFLALATSSVW